MGGAYALDVCRVVECAFDGSSLNEAIVARIGPLDEVRMSREVVLKSPLIGALLVCAKICLATTPYEML